MKYFVLGYDGPALIFMSRKVFSDLAAAESYAKAIAPGWRAFVVSGTPPN